MGRSRLATRWAVVIALSIATISIPAALYFLVYVEGQKTYHVQRYFRSLNEIADQFSATLSAFQSLAAYNQAKTISPDLMKQAEDNVRRLGLEVEQLKDDPEIRPILNDITAAAKARVALQQIKIFEDVILSAAPERREPHSKLLLENFSKIREAEKKINNLQDQDEHQCETLEAKKKCNLIQLIETKVDAEKLEAIQLDASKNKASKLRYTTAYWGDLYAALNTHEKYRIRDYLSADMLNGAGNLKAPLQSIRSAYQDLISAVEKLQSEDIYKSYAESDEGRYGLKIATHLLLDACKNVQTEKSVKSDAPPNLADCFNEASQIQKALGVGFQKPAAGTDVSKNILKITRAESLVVAYTAARIELDAARAIADHLRSNDNPTGVRDLRRTIAFRNVETYRTCADRLIDNVDLTWESRSASAGTADPARRDTTLIVHAPASVTWNKDRALDCRFLSGLFNPAAEPSIPKHIRNAAEYRFRLSDLVDAASGGERFQQFLVANAEGRVIGNFYGTFSTFDDVSDLIAAAIETAKSDSAPETHIDLSLLTQKSGLDKDAGKTGTKSGTREEDDLRILGRSEMVPLRLAGEDHLAFIKPFTPPLPTPGMIGAKKNVASSYAISLEKGFVKAREGMLNESSAGSGSGQEIHRPQQTRWYLIGLIRKTTFDTQVYMIPPNYLGLGTLIAVLGILAIPFLKVRLIGQNEQLTRADANGMAVCVLLTLALGTNFILSKGSYDLLEDRFDNTALKIAAHIDENFSNEVVKSLKDLKTIYLPFAQPQKSTLPAKKYEPRIISRQGEFCAEGWIDKLRVKPKNFHDSEPQSLAQSDSGIFCRWLWDNETASIESITGAEKVDSRVPDYIALYKPTGMLRLTERSLSTVRFSANNTVFALDKRGDQAGRQVSFSATETGAVSLPNRIYFQRALNKQTWPINIPDAPPTPGGFFIERIINAGNGDKTTSFSMPLEDYDRRAWDQAEDIQEQYCPNETWCKKPEVIVLSKWMKTFFAPVLPAGFGFAVVEDSSGTVMFHSDDRKSLNESFYTETDNISAMRGAISARHPAVVDGSYFGKPARFFVQPLKLAPWSLVVFYDHNIVSSAAFEIGVSNTIQVLLYLASIILFIAIMSALVADRPWSWVWPDQRHRDAGTWGQDATRHALGALCAAGLSAQAILSSRAISEGWLYAGAIILGGIALLSGAHLVLDRIVWSRTRSTTGVCILYGAVVLLQAGLGLAGGHVDWPVKIALGVVSLGLLILPLSILWTIHQPRTAEIKKIHNPDGWGLEWVRAFIAHQQPIQDAEAPPPPPKSGDTLTSLRWSFIGCITLIGLCISVVPATLLFRNTFAVEIEHLVKQSQLSVAKKLVERRDAIYGIVTSQLPFLAGDGPRSISYPSTDEGYGIYVDDSLFLQASPKRDNATVASLQAGAKISFFDEKAKLCGSGREVQDGIQSHGFASFVATKFGTYSQASAQLHELAPDCSVEGRWWWASTFDKIDMSFIDRGEGLRISTPVVTWRDAFWAIARTSNIPAALIIALVLLMTVMTINKRVLGLDILGDWFGERDAVARNDVWKRNRLLIRPWPRVVDQLSGHNDEVPTDTTSVDSTSGTDSLPVRRVDLLSLLRQPDWDIQAKALAANMAMHYLVEILEPTLVVAEVRERALSVVSWLARPERSAEAPTDDLSSPKRKIILVAYMNIGAAIHAAIDAEILDLEAHIRAARTVKDNRGLVLSLRHGDAIDKLRQEKIRWTDIMRLFTPHYDWRLSKRTNVFESRPWMISARQQRQPDWRHWLDPLRAAIERECPGHPRLSGIRKQLLKEFGLAEKLNSQDPVATATATSPASRIGDMVGMKAEAIYRGFWEDSTTREKLAIYHLAQGHLVNPANFDVIQGLMRRGLVLRDPEFRLLNESFARFVQDAEPRERFAQWEAAVSDGAWHVIRVPLMIGIGLVIAFVLYSSGENIQALLGLVPAALGAFPVLAKFVASQKSAQ